MSSTWGAAEPEAGSLGLGADLSRLFEKSFCKLNCRKTVNDPCISRPKRKAPEAHAALAAFATEYARREADLEKIAEELRVDRDKAIRKAYKDGLPMSAIAEVLAISHQRVSQIVRS